MSRQKFFSVSIALCTIFSLIAGCGTTDPVSTARPSSPTHTPTPVNVQVETGADLEHFPSDAPFVLRFDQPIEVKEKQVPLDITPQIPGAMRWNAARTEFTFTPYGEFTPGQRYVIRLDKGLKSSSGAIVSHQHEWEIHISSAPRVVERSPNDYSIKQRCPTIRLQFSHDMDKKSVAAALAVEPNVPLDLTWDDKILSIEPLEPLTPGERYAFTLDNSASDANGIPLKKDYHWGYRLHDLIAHTSWPFIAEGYTSPLVIRFNYSLDTHSVEQALTIKPPIEGDTGWNDTHTTLTITPTTRPLNETEYTIAFESPLQDTRGEPFPPPAEPLRFVTPPPIMAVTPRPGSNPSPANTIRITFDRPMDQAMTEAAFHISPTISGSFEWKETTLIFRPDDGYLEKLTTYQVIIEPSARGSDGEPVLNEPYVWSFSTGQLADMATFGIGPNAQTVDADGRRAVQFTLHQPGRASVTFELYSLTTAQFLDRYASGFRGSAGWGKDPTISTEGTTLVQSWQIETPKGSDRHDTQETIIPGDVPPGLYILNLKAGHLNGQLILVLTRNVITVKQAERQIVAWVTDIADGSSSGGDSIPGIEVSVYARDGHLVGSGYTDHNGVFYTTVDRDPQPLIVIARDGKDVTATGLSNEWRSTGDQWRYWWRPAPAALDWAAYTYTDRPIYRPGQTVFFKTIVRRDDDAVLGTPPAGTPVTVRVRDARNNVVQTLSLTTNHFGTANGEFRIAKGAMLGNYAIETVLDGESHRQVFKVQDYRKPDYQVGVTTDAEAYVAGQTITATVDTRYFFGKPVPNARLTINQYELAERPYWDTSSEDTHIWYQAGIPAISGVTDANGRFTFTLEARLGNYDYQSHYWGSSVQQSTWGIEVTADDGSHQTVSSFATVEVLSADTSIVLSTGGYYKTPGVPFTVHANAISAQDEPAPGRRLTLQLCRYNASDRDYTTVLQTFNLTTDGGGRASTSITANESGYYQLRLRGTDSQGNEVGYRTGIYVFDDTSRWVHRGSSLGIAADRERYEAGDTAQLLIESEWSGPALLTFERGTTRREMAIELTAPLTLIEVDIQDDDAPNIYVTVNAWQAQDTTSSVNEYRLNRPDGVLYTASVNLPVSTADKVLNVTITPDKENYTPREKAVFAIHVTDSGGNPVSSEVSLALVDEAIFGLSDELSGPIHYAFYHQRAHIVRTYDGLALVRYKPTGWGGGGGGGYGATNPRSDFPDTAAWFPILHTDAEGAVTVTLTLPDNLTSWRLTAKATTADTKVGETYINIVTQQEIVVRPLLPRGLTAGDRVQLATFVHNYGGHTRRLRVAIAADPLSIEGSITQTVLVRSGERGLVSWWAAADQAGEARITVSAQSGVAGDGVQLTLSVRPLAVPDVRTYVGAFEGELAKSIYVPEDALDMSVLHVELSRSVGGSMMQGLEYLTGYPYGCVEQTMSRALPNAVVGRAFHQLGIGDPTIQADLPPKINASVQRLYGFQHNDGGWGWWYDDASDAYQTAWVVFGLSMTAEAGYEVDRNVIKRGTDWLAAHLGSMDARTRAYALYSMAVAGHGDLEATQTMLGHLEELDTFSRAALALALHKLSAEQEALQVLDLLAETAIVQDGQVYWAEGISDGHYRRKTMSSATRSTALALSAFARVGPGHELEPGIVRWLMGQRRHHGWGTTNETSYAIIGLTDHLLATEYATASMTYGVFLNGERIAGGTLGRGEPAASLEIPAGQMRQGSNQLRLEQSGGGRLYYTISSKIYRPRKEIGAAGRVEVSRTYLDARTNRPITFTRPGQLVKVQLTIAVPQDSFYLIVEDNVPGGLEPLNEGLNTTSHEASASKEPHYYWREYGYNHKQVYGDRVSFFITELPKGKRTLTYLARATHTGKFTAMPAEAYAMYDLETWGRSASDVFVVEESEQVGQAIKMAQRR